MASAAMLDSGHQAFFDAMHEFLFKVATFLPNLVKFGQQLKERHQFSKFKMAAAAILDSGNRAFFDAMDEFVFKVATFLSNLIEFGK